MTGAHTSSFFSELEIVAKIQFLFCLLEWRKVGSNQIGNFFVAYKIFTTTHKRKEKKI